MYVTGSVSLSRAIWKTLVADQSLGNSVEAIGWLVGSVAAKCSADAASSEKGCGLRGPVPSRPFNDPDLFREGFPGGLFEPAGP